MKWYLQVLKKYTDFNGRAELKEYWMFILFNYMFIFIIMRIDRFMETTITIGNLRYGIFNILYVLAVFIPGKAVAVRRLHDIGKSGWYYFLILIPIVGWIWLFFLLITDGVVEENKYGTNPKETVVNSETTIS